MVNGILKIAVFGILAAIGIAGIILGIVLATLKDVCESIKDNSVHVDKFKLSAENANLRADWNRLSNFAECYVYYKLTIDNTTRYTGKNYFVFEYVEYCTELEVTLIPFISEIQQIQSNDIYTYLDVPEHTIQVNNFTLSEEDGKLRAVWSPPNNIKECNVSYKLTVNEDIEEHITDESYFIFDHEVVYCVDMEVTLTPIVNMKEQNISTDTYTRDILESFVNVENFKLSGQDGKLNAEWDPLDNFAECNVTYNLTVNWDNDVYITQQTYFEFAYVEYCTDLEATLTPYINGKEQKRSKATYAYLEVPEFTIQTNNFTLSEEDGKLRADWITQSNIKQCNIRYMLTINEDNNEYITEETYFVFDHDVEYCSEFKVTLTPFINEKEQVQSQDTYTPEIPHDFGTVFEEMSFDIVDSSLMMTWSLKEQGSCSVTFSGSCVEEEALLDLEIIASPHVFTSCQVSDELPHKFTVVLQPTLDSDIRELGSGGFDIPKTRCIVEIDGNEVTRQACEVSIDEDRVFNMYLVA